jgi:Skp family chaperone for outer membrane proteins
MDRVMSESRMGKAEQASIDRLRTVRTSLINQKQKELEEREEQIRNASLSWSAEKREERLREYETKRIELRRLNEDATRDVQAEFNRSLAKLQRAALEVTGVIGLEQGYTLIFEKRSVPVLFASESIDVTAEVIRRLDIKFEPTGAATDSTPGGGR